MDTRFPSAEIVREPLQKAPFPIAQWGRQKSGPLAVGSLWKDSCIWKGLNGIQKSRTQAIITVLKPLNLYKYVKKSNVIYIKLGFEATFGRGSPKIWRHSRMFLTI